MLTRSNSPGQKERKKIGDLWFSKKNFRLEKSKYIYYKDLFKLMSQIVIKQKKQENFISFLCKDLARFLEKIVKNNENKC